jgi:hypothetical protein
MLSQQLGGMCDSRKRLSGWAWWLLKHSSFNSVVKRHRWMDWQFAKNRVVYADTSGHRIYLALGIEAIKPSGDSLLQAASNS